MKLFLLMLFALFSIISTQMEIETYEKYDVMKVQGFFQNGMSKIYVVQFFKNTEKKPDIKIKSCLRDCGPKPRIDSGNDCLEKCLRKYGCSNSFGNSIYKRNKYFDCYEW